MQPAPPARNNGDETDFSGLRPGREDDNHRLPCRPIIESSSTQLCACPSVKTRRLWVKYETLAELQYLSNPRRLTILLLLRLETIFPQNGQGQEAKVLGEGAEN